MVLNLDQKRKLTLMIRKDLAALEDQRYSYEMAMKHHINEFQKKDNQVDPYSKRIIEDYKKLIEIYELDISLLESIKKEVDNYPTE